MKGGEGPQRGSFKGGPIPAPTSAHTGALRFLHPSFQYMFKERAPALGRVFGSALNRQRSSGIPGVRQQHAPCPGSGRGHLPTAPSPAPGPGLGHCPPPGVPKKALLLADASLPGRGSLSRFAPGASALPHPADPSPTPAGVKLAAGGGSWAPGRLGAPARAPRRRLPWLPRNIYFHSMGSRGYRGGHAATDGKPSHPGDKDRPATPREPLQRLPRGALQPGRRGEARRAPPGPLAGGREAGGRVHTHPQAAAPDLHVALLHDVIETGGHPGRPASSPRPARALTGLGSRRGSGLGWGRKRRPSGGGSARRQEARITFPSPSLEVGGRLAATSGSAGSRSGWGARVS